jgi:hypothetical protein
LTVAQASRDRHRGVGKEANDGADRKGRNGGRPRLPEKDNPKRERKDKSDDPQIDCIEIERVDDQIMGDKQEKRRKATYRSESVSQ